MLYQKGKAHGSNGLLVGLKYSISAIGLVWVDPCMPKAKKDHKTYLNM